MACQFNLLHITIMVTKQQHKKVITRWTLTLCHRRGCLRHHIIETRCDFDLWPPTSNQVISRDMQLFPVSFITIAQVVHEIWCSKDLTSTACCDLDLWPPESNQVISRGLVNITWQFHQNYSSRSWDIVAAISDRTRDSNPRNGSRIHLHNV